MTKPDIQTIRAKKLGVLIKDARTMTGFTEDESAKILGLTADDVKSFEDGSKPPTLPQLEVLAYYLDIPLDHFLGDKSRTSGVTNQIDSEVSKQLRVLRNKIIGVLIKISRLEMGLSIIDLANIVNIEPDKLENYETGIDSPPFPLLEKLAETLNIPIEYFMSKKGVIGNWASNKRHVSDFLDLPPEIQEFVIKPVNRPYLEVAQRLSELSAEKLRSLAEGLLDITY